MPVGSDDERFAQYLLGSLSEEESQRLDELSIANDEVAWRLSEVENDLVDAYARGEMHGERLRLFEQAYLSSPSRREKVAFAETLQRWEREKASEPAKASAEVKASTATADHVRPRWFEFPWFRQWGFAVTATLLVITVALLIKNEGLRREIKIQSAVAGDQRRLQRELDSERAAKSSLMDEMARLRASQGTVAEALPIPTFLLAVPTRGAGHVAEVRVLAGVKSVRLRLQLEANDFRAYTAALKDPSTGRLLWRSGKLVATLAGTGNAVTITLSTRLLQPRNYLVEVNGRADDKDELIATYPFRVVLQ